MRIDKGRWHMPKVTLEGAHTQRASALHYFQIKGSGGKGFSRESLNLFKQFSSSRRVEDVAAKRCSGHHPSEAPLSPQLNID
jgi:hypothetical protein